MCIRDRVNDTDATGGGGGTSSIDLSQSLNKPSIYPVKIPIDPDANGPAPSFLLSSDYIRGFNFLSLRSNFILKWEYRPGSSLFLVWQQQRDHFEITDDDLNLNDGFEKLIESQSVNTFMVKFAYWLSS